MQQIKYNRKKCISCGICAIEASHIWELNTFDGKADLLGADFKKDHYFRMLWPDEEKVMKKVEGLCLTRAIHLL